MKLNRTLRSLLLMSALANVLPVHAVESLAAQPGLPPPPARALITGTEISDLQALLAAQPQLKSGDKGDKTPSGLPRMYGVTARALKQHASAEQVLALLKLNQKDAKQGNLTALWNLGKFYEEGLGVKQDSAAAMKWYRKAADKGDADAQNQIGYFYNNAVGTARDLVKARHWFELAAQQGEPAAMLNLAMLNRTGSGYGDKGNQALARVWFDKAAQLGNADGQYQLGLCYLNGSGINKDEALAVSWLRKAAEQQQAEAQNLLGELTTQGLAGITPDLDVAMALFKQAAPTNAMAAYHLANIFELSTMFASEAVTQKNNSEALYWYHRSAENGNALAQLRLGELYTLGTILPKSFEETARYYGYAAKNGNAEAQYRYARLFCVGQGVVKDQAQSEHWMYKAANQGHPKAMEVVSCLDKKAAE